MLQPNFSPFPTLITERLLLRQLTPADAEDIFAIRNDTTVNKYLGRAKTTSHEEALQFIEKMNKGIAANQSVYWVICFKDSREFAGTICLWNIDIEKGSAETGYELLPRFHGMGIMQEALTALISYGFDTMQLNSITAFTVAANTSSAKLLERNHFRLYGNEGEEVIYQLQRGK